MLNLKTLKFTLCHMFELLAFTNLYILTCTIPSLSCNNLEP